MAKAYLCSAVQFNAPGPNDPPGKNERDPNDSKRFFSSAQYDILADPDTSHYYIRKKGGTQTNSAPFSSVQYATPMNVDFFIAPPSTTDVPPSKSYVEDMIKSAVKNTSRA